MNKIMRFIAVFMVSMTALSVSAQDSEVVFNPHWDLKIQAGASYTQGAGDFSDLISPAAALSVGYQFTPVFSLRLGASGWQGRGGFVYSDATYKYNYIQANLGTIKNIV